MGPFEKQVEQMIESVVDGFSDADQQRVAGAVASQARSFSDSRRSTWAGAADWSDAFKDDFYSAANKLLKLWDAAGSPLPEISGFEVLSDGMPYKPDGSGFSKWLRSLMLVK